MDADEAQSGRARVYEHLTSQVLVDPAQQGCFLNEKEIAAVVGVSRTPVREALLVLASEGLVEMIPRRGARVRAITGREITELMEMRSLIEVHAAATVIERAQAPLTAMGEVLEKQRALAGEDPRCSGLRFIELDRAFHQVLVDAAGNELISRTYASLRARQVIVGVEALHRRSDRQERVCSEHAEILQGLRAHDTARTRTAIEHHLSITLDLLLRS